MLVGSFGLKNNICFKNQHNNVAHNNLNFKSTHITDELLKIDPQIKISSDKFEIGKQDEQTLPVFQKHKTFITVPSVNNNHRKKLKRPERKYIQPFVKGENKIPTGIFAEIITGLNRKLNKAESKFLRYLITKQMVEKQSELIIEKVCDATNSKREDIKILIHELINAKYIKSNGINIELEEKFIDLIKNKK